MIGGRVLDADAIEQFASNRSMYMQALVWVALEEGIVLAMAASSIAEAWADCDATARDAVDVLLGLPVTVVDTLDADTVRPVGELLSTLAPGHPGHVVSAAHTAYLARRRGWPVVTSAVERVTPYGVEIEELP